MVNWKAYRNDKKLLQNSLNSYGPLVKKIEMFRNTLLIIFKSSLSLWYHIFAFWESYGWTSRAFWTSITTWNQKYCGQQPLDRHLMSPSGNFLTSLCASKGIYWWLMLNWLRQNSVIVVTSWNTISYKLFFFRGILLRMHDRSDDGVIHLAI